MNMDRLLLVTCLIVGLTISVHAACPPNVPPARCRHASGGFKKRLVELLERNLSLDELDDSTLQRALELLLESERDGQVEQRDFTLDEQERSPPHPGEDGDGEAAERARSDEHLRDLLRKLRGAENARVRGGGW